MNCVHIRVFHDKEIWRISVRLSDRSEVTQHKINFIKNCRQWALNSQPPEHQSNALPSVKWCIKRKKVRWIQWILLHLGKIPLRRLHSYVTLSQTVCQVCVNGIALLNPICQSLVKNGIPTSNLLSLAISVDQQFRSVHNIVLRLSSSFSLTAHFLKRRWIKYAS